MSRGGRRRETEYVERRLWTSDLEHHEREEGVRHIDFLGSGLSHTMLDVEPQRVSHQYQAHVAGLKRLSARAKAGPTTPPGTRRVHFSFAAYARTVIDHLKKFHVPIAKGLSDEEFERVEAAFGFTFPPDLKGILQEGLPVGEGFPDWRREGSQQLRMRLSLPIAGISHEVGTGQFWWKHWGPRPADTDQAVRIARIALRKSPILVPIYNHCYIPCWPNLAGNPVFFVYRKDVVYCGYDVADFFEREAFLPHELEPPLEFPAFLDLSEGLGRLGSSRDLLRGGDSGSGRRDGDDVGQQGRTEGERDSDRDLDSVHRDSNSSTGTDSTEASGSGKSDGSGETWGRNLDSLAKHSEAFLGSSNGVGKQLSAFGRFQEGGSSRRLTYSKSFDVRSLDSDDCPRNGGGPDDLSRYNFSQERTLSSKTLLHFAMPAWPARIPRRIEFWSDLAEKQQAMHAAAQAEGLFSACKVDEDLSKVQTKFVQKHLADTKDQDPTKNEEAIWNDKAFTDFHNSFVPRSLTGYLQEISSVLRNGGWKEDDISDMMDTSPPREQWNQQLDAQAVLDGLVRQVELLSTSLKKAGWSNPDVTDTMKLDLPYREPRRAASKLSPELAARISKLAEYVAQA